MSPTRYHLALVVLHWAITIMVFVALGMGTFVLTEIPNTSPDKVMGLNDHVIAGMSILVLMLMRLGVRLSTKKPPHATTGNTILDKVGVFTHYAFYVLVFLMAASGIGTLMLAGLSDFLFGGLGALLPESFYIFPLRIAHGIVAKLLIALIALHAFAALFHQFVLKDRIIARMWFGERYEQ